MFVVSIIGRPNVGKSTLFNRLTRSSISVVHRECGITRDRKSKIFEIGDNIIELVDTGGIIFDKRDTMQQLITKQALYAMKSSNLILFVMDVNELLHLDLEILEMLRKSGKYYINVVNKVDSRSKEDMLFDFYRNGITSFLSVSATQNSNISLLEKEIISFIPQDLQTNTLIKDIPKICISGKPNVGKSTYINALLNKERLIVSDIPGTTRDSVDTIVYYYKKPYIFIDTAGLRRKSRVKGDIEGIFNRSAIKSIDNSDYVLLMLDSLEGFTNQDHKIINIIESKGKGLILGLNKWDLVEKSTMTFKNYQDDIYEKVTNWGKFPVISFSALNKKRITHIFSIIDKLDKASSYRIATSKFNEFINSLFSETSSGYNIPKGNLKIYYSVNVGIKPHRFVLWSNSPKLVKTNFRRFLINKIRKEFNLDGLWIDLIFRERAKKK